MRQCPGNVLVLSLAVGINFKEISCHLQSFGCVALLNYLIMKIVIASNREILLSVQGTNVWSGAAIQSFNRYLLICLLHSFVELIV